MNQDPTLQVKEPSAIVRNLGIIKGAAIVMGVLIIILTAVVVGTIASRLAKITTTSDTLALTLPQGGFVSSAGADGDGIVLVIDLPKGQQIWRLGKDGQRWQTITLQQP